MLIAQVTDTHIVAPGAIAYQAVDTAAYLARCMAAMRELPTPPDLVVMTGDLVDHGRPEEYEHLRTLLAGTPAPILFLAGNHDDREALRAVFADQHLPRRGFLQYVAEAGPLRLIALDTLVPGHGHGALCGERLDWLEARLADAPGAPTVIAMHHPPFATGIAYMDAHGLREGGERLGAIVRRHPQVERILCGHLHRSIQARVGGTIASTAPSPAHQVALDLRAGAPLSLIMEPPAYQLHLWREGAGLVTHTAVVPPAPEAYPFIVREGKRPR